MFIPIKSVMFGTEGHKVEHNHVKAEVNYNKGMKAFVLNMHLVNVKEDGNFSFIMFSSPNTYFTVQQSGRDSKKKQEELNKKFVQEFESKSGSMYEALKDFVKKYSDFLESDIAQKLMQNPENLEKLQTSLNEVPQNW